MGIRNDGHLTLLPPSGWLALCFGLALQASAQSLPDESIPILRPELLEFVCPERDEEILTSVAPPTAAEEAWLARREAFRAVLPAFLARVPAEPPDVLWMPVQGIRVSQIADTWHAPRGNRLHEGQDVFAPRGTAVLAATDGIVYEVSDRFTGGRGVMLLGPGAVRTFYTHLESYAEGIREGMWIEARSIIGFVGDDGNAAGTPPHLHFGVYAFDPETCRLKAYDPLPLLHDW